VDFWRLRGYLPFMPFPKSVSVGGVKFSISMDPKHTDEDEYGKFHIDKKVIGINAKLCETEELKYVTLYHEMCHAATHVSGLAYRHSDKAEECLVRMLENILLPAFKKVHEVELEEG
jgi:Zn-dependent peptidase ImmA (M78 family)